MSDLSERLVDSLPPTAGATGAGWLAALKARAAETFRSTGLPTRRVEQWKYTPLQALERRAATLGPPGSRAARLASPMARRRASRPPAAVVARSMDASRRSPPAGSSTRMAGPGRPVPELLLGPMVAMRPLRGSAATSDRAG